MGAGASPSCLQVRGRYGCWDYVWNFAVLALHTSLMNKRASTFVFYPYINERTIEAINLENKNEDMHCGQKTIAVIVNIFFEEDIGSVLHNFILHVQECEFVCWVCVEGWGAGQPWVGSLPCWPLSSTILPRVQCYFPVGCPSLS